MWLWKGRTNFCGLEVPWTKKIYLKNPVHKWSEELISLKKKCIQVQFQYATCVSNYIYSRSQCPASFVWIVGLDSFMCFNSGYSYHFSTHFPVIHLQSEVLPLHLACFHTGILLELKPFALVSWFWHASQEVALLPNRSFPHCTLQAAPSHPHSFSKDLFHSL